MNRLSSLIAAGLTTGLSAAAVGATAVGQGIFGGGSTAPEAPATGETDTAIETAVAQQPTAVPGAVATQVIYVDKEPIVVTRQVIVSDGRSDGAQTGGGETAAPAGAGAQVPQPPPVDTPASVTPPAPTPPPAMPAPPEPVPTSPRVALPTPEPPPAVSVLTGGGGPASHDGRGEREDDTQSGEGDDHKDEDHREHEDDRDEEHGGDDD